MKKQRKANTYQRVETTYFVPAENMNYQKPFYAMNDIDTLRRSMMLEQMENKSSEPRL